MKTIKLALLLCSLTWVLSGCQTTQPNEAKTQRSARSFQQIGYNQTLSEHVVAVSKKVNGVDEAVSVVIGKDISIALKVSGIDRFRLRGIRKEVSNQLKRDLSDRYAIHVTTDKKLFRDMQTLHRKLIQGQGKPKDIMKTYKKLNDDMHG